MTLNNKGAIEETIVLPPYRAPTTAERAEQEATEAHTLRDAEAAFEAAKATLRSLDWENWSTNMSELRTGMLAVERADQALQQARFPLMEIRRYKSVRTNAIHFDKPGDEHMIRDVVALATRPRTLQVEYVRSTPLAEAPPIPTTVAGAAAAANPAEPVQLIDQDSPLSSWAPHDIVVNGVTYPTVQHALLAEVAAALGNE